MMNSEVNRKGTGFTLIELMVVIAIIGIIAAIAVPNFMQYRANSFNAAANSDVKNAYNSAQNYFTDNPTEEVTLGLLSTHGFIQSDGVTVTVVDGHQGLLNISARHDMGSKTYSVSSTGVITTS